MSPDEATLIALDALCDDVAAPWKLVPYNKTLTETIILHDANGIAIADLYTSGAATPPDKLIAMAPTVIAELVAEVRRQRASFLATRDVLAYAERAREEGDPSAIDALKYIITTLRAALQTGSAGGGKP